MQLSRISKFIYTFILVQNLVYLNGWPAKSLVKKNYHVRQASKRDIIENRLFLPVGIALIAVGLGFSPPVLAEQSLVEQLKVIQALQLQEQKENLDKQNQEVLQKSLTYDTVKLIARGVVSLVPPGNSADPSLYPLGLSDASLLDPAFANKDATIYLTAVGREGPPIAAKKYKLENVKFPLVFEISTDDLFFPYTEDAWLKSPLSSDTIAVTCILDTDGSLVTPSEFDRFGFALSEPVKLGGAFQRTEAKIAVSLKSDGKPYAPEELEMLSRIEREISRIESSKTDQQLKVK